MKDIQFQELVYFLTDLLGLDPAHRFHRDTLLDKDLHTYGDDATEMLAAYSKVFHVDVSNFRIADYVRPEGITSFGIPKKVKDLTLGDLEKGITAGQLNEDVLSDKAFRRIV